MFYIISYVIIGIFCIIGVYNTATHINLKRFDSQTYKYNVSFEKKGQTYKVTNETKSFDNPVVSCYGAHQKIIYINENPVVVILKIDNVFSCKRTVHTTSKYDDNDIFTILKWAKKAYDKNWHENFEIKCESTKLIKK